MNTYTKADLIKIAELLGLTDELLKKQAAKVEEPKLDRTVLRIVKLASLVECAKYICKIAEASGEVPPSEAEVIEMVARADGKLPDTVVETADDNSLKTMMVESLVRASEEMASSDPARVQPEDVQIKNLGEGSILKEVATNPNARVDGVDILPEVNVIELNLLSTDTGKGEPKMEKDAAVTKIAELTNLMMKIANEVEMLKNKIDSQTEAVNPASTEATKTEDATQANPREAVSALTKEDNIFESKTNDAEVAALVAAPEKSTAAADKVVAEADGAAKQSFASAKPSINDILKKYNKTRK